MTPPCCDARRELDAIHARLTAHGVPTILRRGDGEVTTETRVAHVCHVKQMLESETLDAWRVLQAAGYTDFDPHAPIGRNTLSLASRIGQILDRMQRAETQVAALKQMVRDVEVAA